jgi:hypothetical protein
MSAETPSAADMVAQARPMMDAFFPRGAVPTTEETAKAKKDAQGVLDWLRANLAKHRDSADIARDLEDMLFEIGSFRMLWALMPDEDAAGRYLVEREALSNQAPFEVQCAFAKAESREHEERAAMFETVHNLRMTADRLQSERLRRAADVFEQMMGFFRVEPDGPARAARTTGAKKAAAAKHATGGELKSRIVAECLNHKKGTQWKNPAARKLAPDAFQWNMEAGKPFTWLDIPATEKQVRRWLADL